MNLALSSSVTAKHIKELIRIVGITVGNLLANTNLPVANGFTECLLTPIERLLDICAVFDLDPSVIVKEKMNYNRRKY